MEVLLTMEQQVRLQQIATEAGTEPAHVVSGLVSRYLEADASFLSAVDRGLAAAARGEFIEEDEMDARLEAMFGR